MNTYELRRVDYHHDDAQLLIAEVQQEYVRRYGGPDDTRIDDHEFSPPHGMFVIAYDGDRPVAMGGWRLVDPIKINVDLPGTSAELKRMYVVPASRGRGYARAVLDHLERAAAAAGADWLVLETGDQQPEAVALYQSTGYRSVPAFGHYADQPSAIHLGKMLVRAGRTEGIPTETQ